MTQISVPSKRKRNALAHSREQFIYYMGRVVNDSSSSLAPLKKIVATKEFKGLLTLLSGVGTPGLIKLLESASRNCAAKKAERAEKKNDRKGADAVGDRLGSNKRLKMHETGRSSHYAKGTAYDEPGVSEPLPPYSKESSIQKLSTSSVKTEDEDPVSKSIGINGYLTGYSGQAGDEQINVGTAHPSEFSSTRDKALQSESWGMYKREVGIIRRDPKIMAPLEDHCCTTLVKSSNYDSGKLKKEVGELLSDIEQLDFLFAKDRLVSHLNNRQAKLGMQTATPATWAMSEPQQVLGALRIIKTNCDDTHIHRVFGQMKLCLLVQEKLRSGHTPISSGKGKPRLPETNYLADLARRDAGPVSEDEIEAKHQEYLSEHQAGKRWLEVADWFGGPGIVLVFITAGIGSYHVAAGWKVFQRDCLKYISQSLYSIKGLVGALGTDCLEKYCQYGHLPQKYINKVIEYEGIIPAEEIDEDGSEMDETEEDAPSAEAHDGKDDKNGIDTGDSDEESGSGEDTSGDDEDASEH